MSEYETHNGPQTVTALRRMYNMVAVAAGSVTGFTLMPNTKKGGHDLAVAVDVAARLDAENGPVGNMINHLNDQRLPGTLAAMPQSLDDGDYLELTMFDHTIVRASFFDTETDKIAPLLAPEALEGFANMLLAMGTITVLEVGVELNPPHFSAMLAVDTYMPVAVASRHLDGPNAAAINSGLQETKVNGQVGNITASLTFYVDPQAHN